MSEEEVINLLRERLAIVIEINKGDDYIGVEAKLKLVNINGTYEIISQDRDGCWL